MGLKFKILKKYNSYNNRTKLVDIEILPSILKAPEDKIHANPYPGINMDNLPFFVPICIKAKGTTLIHDWVYENRAIYFLDFQKLGANLTLLDPHRVFVEGPSKLRGAELMCPPAIRPAVALLVAMIAASGKSILRNSYTIERGYEDLTGRLSKVGVHITYEE
jgi:UDP-N-acetylglucosamine 1-carboxyvinyltransferase